MITASTPGWRGVICPSSEFIYRTMEQMSSSYRTLSLIVYMPPPIVKRSNECHSLPCSFNLQVYMLSFSNHPHWRSAQITTHWSSRRNPHPKVHSRSKKKGMRRWPAFLVSCANRVSQDIKEIQLRNKQKGQLPLPKSGEANLIPTSCPSRGTG